MLNQVTAWFPSIEGVSGAQEPEFDGIGKGKCPHDKNRPCQKLDG